MRSIVVGCIRCDKSTIDKHLMVIIKCNSCFICNCVIKMVSNKIYSFNMIILDYRVEVGLRGKDTASGRKC